MQDRGVIRLGLAGLGSVGAGLARIVEENRDWIKRRLGRDLAVKTVLVRDASKRRDLPAGASLTTRLEELIHDPEIDIVVELMGGLDAPYRLIKGALEAGKHVVTANKALLAERGQELFALAARRGLGLYYEASVAGGIPIVQTLKESLAGNRIERLMGILNGTCNFILSEMTDKGLDFQTALKLAQDKGYAEADPTLDIDGIDAAHKLVLLIRLAFGQHYPMEKLAVTGIRDLAPEDIAYARDFGYRIKLIGSVRQERGHLEAGVFPALLPENYLMARVDSNFNAVRVEGNAVGPVMLYGQGAGGLPTGSAVLADIMSLARGCVPNNTGFGDADLGEADILPMEQAVFRHYFRFTVADRSGVLAEVGRIMGARDISIAQAVQKSVTEGRATVVFLTHEAQEAAVRAAIEEIDACDFIGAKTVHLRIL